MALPTGALKREVATVVNHIANGGQIASAGFSVAADVDVAFTNTDGYAFCDLVITLTKASAGTAGLGIRIYMRALNILSTTDAPEPDANFKWEDVGFLVTDAVATEQVLALHAVALPSWHAVEFYVENLTGVTINNTWDLDIYPWTWATQA